MNLLAPEKTFFLFICTTLITNLFLVAFSAYLFRQLFHLKVTLGYTIKTMKKLHPEIVTETDMETTIKK